jgi:hypothetical protein
LPYSTLFMCYKLRTNIYIYIHVHCIWFKIELFLFSGAQVATSLLQQRANDVRSNRVNWQSYLQSVLYSDPQNIEGVDK